MGTTKKKLPFELTIERQEAINANYEWAAPELERAGYFEQAARMRARKKKLPKRWIRAS